MYIYVCVVCILNVTQCVFTHKCMKVSHTSSNVSLKNIDRCTHGNFMSTQVMFTETRQDIHREMTLWDFTWQCGWLRLQSMMQIFKKWNYFRYSGTWFRLHWNLVTKYTGDCCQHWAKYQHSAQQSPSHYINWRWLTDNRNFRNKVQHNLNQSTDISVWDVFENVFCKTSHFVSICHVLS